MDLTQSLLLIAALIAASAFFSLAEISLAASRRLRLRQMADEGDARADHDWGRLLAEEPGDDVLDHLSTLAPREMRRALMTGFGNARLARRDEIRIDDLPRANAGKTRMGFVQ